MNSSAKAIVAGLALTLTGFAANAETVSNYTSQFGKSKTLSSTYTSKRAVRAVKKISRKKRTKRPSIKRSGRRTKYLALAKRLKPAGLPISLVDAVITMESGYNPGARGRHGEIGLMQVKPATARMVRSLTGVRAGALSVPANNLRIGMAYLNWCYRRAKSSIPATIGCYNAGPGNMWKWQKFAVTRKYVRFVRNRVASN